MIVDWRLETWETWGQFMQVLSTFSLVEQFGTRGGIVPQVTCNQKSAERASPAGATSNLLVSPVRHRQQASSLWCGMPPRSLRRPSARSKPTRFRGEGDARL